MKMQRRPPPRSFIFLATTCSTTSPWLFGARAQPQEQPQQAIGQDSKNYANAHAVEKQHELGQEAFNGAYFQLAEGETKTFVKILSARQVFQASWRTLDEDRASHCRLEFRDPNGEVKGTQNVAPTKAANGKFSMFTNEEGEHTFSITCGETYLWGRGTSRSKWSLVLEASTPSVLGPLLAPEEVGLGRSALLDPADAVEVEEDRPQGISNQQISTLDQLLKEVKEQTELLHAENEYEKKQTAKFEHAIQSNIRSMRVLNVLMSIMILLCTLYQGHDLKKFFRAQKLL